MTSLLPQRKKQRVIREAGRLLHYTAKPLETIRSCDQTEVGTGSYYAKPRGLWLSVEGEQDWREWCEAESFGNIAAALCYDITLAPNARIRRIRTAGGIRRFTDRYGMDPFMGPMAGRTQMFGMGVDWQRVSERYDGIIIAPYQWDCRYEELTRWYYGWDCASGCIWNARAISSWERVQ